MFSKSQCQIYLVKPKSTVSITSPGNNAVLTVGSNIMISANAADSDGTIAKVEFYQGSSLLGSDTSAPYSFTWTNVASGNYSLSAKALDNQGAVKTSTAISIIVRLPVIDWQLSRGDVGNQGPSGRIIVLPTGESIYIGSSWSGMGDGPLVTKISASGGDVWSNVLGNALTGYSRYGHNVSLTTDRNILCICRVGETEYPGGSKALLYRLNSNGTRSNLGNGGAKMYDYSNRDESGNDVIDCGNGSYIFVGFRNPENGQSGPYGGNTFTTDAYIMKVNVDGAVLWQNVYGSSMNDGFSRICKTLDGYLAVGNTNGNDGLVSGNHGETDIWLVMIDSAGTLLWQKCLGGTENEGVADINLTSDGGFILTGGTKSNNGDVSAFRGGDSDVWVVKLNLTGAIEWQKCLGGSGDDGGSAVVQTSDGGYVVAASTNSNDGDVAGNHGSSDIWVVKLSSASNIQWQKCLGGSNSDTSSGIQQTPDGGFVIVGATSSDDGDVSWQNGGVLIIGS